jgi:hypothetical protein
MRSIDFTVGFLAAADSAGRDQPQLLHTIKNGVAAALGDLGVVVRIGGPRALHDTGEGGGLAQVEIRGVHIEVVDRGRLDAIGQVAVVGEVHIALEDLTLGHRLLDVHGQAHLAQLAGVVDADRLGGGGLVALLQRLLLEGQLDVLLRDRGATLGGIAGGIVEEGPEGAADVDGAVVEEPVVLDGHLRLLHDRGDLGQLDDDAVLVIRRGDDLVVCVVDA